MKGREVGFGHTFLTDQAGDIALFDEIGDFDVITDGIEEVLGLANQPAIEPIRRGGEANDAQLRIEGLQLCQERAIHSIARRANEMGFVHDDQVEAPQQFRLAIDTLDARDNRRIFGVVTPQPCRVEPDVQGRTEGLDFLGILLEQFLDVGKQ